MKVKSIIYMVLALSLCCGCSDWLTVDSKTILSEEDIAKYPELAEAQFLSNYAELRKSIHCIGDGAMSYRQHHLDAFTDDGASNITYENGVMRNNTPGTVFGGVFSQSKGEIFEAVWNYKTINIVNKFIATYKNSDNEGVLSTVGEAYFIRAYLYFEMVKRYGGVPLYSSPLDDVSSINNRSTEEKSWDYIKDNLDSALVLLPKVQRIASEDRDRANRYTALALKSRAMLYAGTIAKYGKVSNNSFQDIRKRDAENLKREKEWKEEMMRKGANKDKRKRPENLIIQEIDADMTNPAFVMRTAEAKEHFLYTSLNEIDQFDALRGIGNQQFRIMCLAFDPSNKFGQSRVGIQSVTERVCVRFNWNASTTIDKGQRYFAKVLTDGPLSRINFCTIPEREIGEDIPVYGTYDDEFRNSLKPYIENLCMASGLVECQEAYDLAVVLKNENAEFARTSQNRIFENFSFRANVIAYLKACVLYVANGYRWEPEIDDFIRWSERYDLYCKMRFFGDMIARENSAGEKSSKRGPENLLQLLPDIFTMPQLDAIRLEHGLDAKGTRNVIKQWIYRGYIERISPPGEDGKSGYGYSSYSFKKLKYRHDGLVLEA